MTGTAIVLDAFNFDNVCMAVPNDGHRKVWLGKYHHESLLKLDDSHEF